jgi:hypothetical protein
MSLPDSVVNTFDLEIAQFSARRARTRDDSGSRRRNAAAKKVIAPARMIPRLLREEISGVQCETDCVRKPSFKLVDRVIADASAHGIFASAQMDGQLAQTLPSTVADVGGASSEGGFYFERND